MDDMHFDVVVVGAGPAGLFSALALSGKGLAVALIDKGKTVDQRVCPAREQKKCLGCEPCAVVSGWGGAGAFSDGKLTLTTEFGGTLERYTGKEQLSSYIDMVDSAFCSFGGSDAPLYSASSSQLRTLVRQAARADLQFIPAKVRHLGTERARTILEQIYQKLVDDTTILTKTRVVEILTDGSRVSGVRTEKGQKFFADFVVCAPGREGASWFTEQMANLNLRMDVNPVDLGVRVEVPAAVLEDITDKVYESKLVYYSRSFDDKVRTFCMNPRGEVVLENNGGVITVNGHSYAQKKTNNTNFALLVSKNFTEPFREPIAYGRSIAALANMLGGGAIVQRLGDLLAGRRSTAERIDRGLVRPTLAATPGDLSLVLPFRYLQSIVEMLEAMDKVAPGVASRHTLLYGVEVKFYSARLKLSKKLETEVTNMFAAGDGAGITRGLAQAAAAGLHVAGEILARKGVNQCRL